MQPHEVMIPIILFLTIGAIFLMWIISRHRERMVMVEKGMSSEDIKALYSKTVQRDPLSSLKWGILFVLGGVAVMFGNFLVERFNVQPPVVIGMVCLFVGIGLVLFYTIASKKMGQK
jgi:Na+/melibiose symporter-like transporter